ncbi:MAG: FAD-binding oxidoreductase [Pseudomonadales bacterium]|nr:FAD-binding oxidoreductase [Pseudomonadales bacterium]
MIDHLTLGEIVGKDNVYTGPDAEEKYGQDWTRFHTPLPGAVVFARDIPQLVRLVEYARREQIGLVPSGGRTGLSAGAVAANQEIVVSFEKMNRILDFDEVDRSVTVEAGVITQQLQDFASGKGLQYPVDFASSGSSQIGGNIATNAGGIRVLRYGLTRDQILGLKVVTGRGDVLELNRGLVKNATGYDFRHLFIGSEGTLGLIVEATIRLTRQPAESNVILMSVPRMADVMKVFQAFMTSIDLTAYEFFSDNAISKVIEHGDLNRPFERPSEYYVLLEFEHRANERDIAASVFEKCVAESWVTDGIISQNERQRVELWQYRERISESISKFTPYKNDISVRVSEVPQFLSEVHQAVNRRYPDFEIIWFGHIGDGNVHLNVLKPDDWAVEDFKRECESVSEEVLGIVAGFGGSISAEHGVGLLKRDQLGFSRSNEEIELMRQVKQVFDPSNIMNPGKLLS